jgi:tyrosinase
MKQFRQAMTAIQGINDKRGFNHIAGYHGAPGYYCWHHQHDKAHTQMVARLFLPWHRAYLLTLEHALQDQVSGTALPWWDWTQIREVPASYAQEQIGGARNPLYSSHAQVPSANPPIDKWTTRDPGANSWGSLATKAEIDKLLGTKNWADFSDQLQGYHDHVHVWVGGDMATVDTAGFDPIFFAHHAMVDRLWHLWQIDNGKSTGIPQNLLGVSLALGQSLLSAQYFEQVALIPSSLQAFVFDATLGRFLLF